MSTAYILPQLRRDLAYAEQWLAEMDTRAATACVSGPEWLKMQVQRQMCENLRQQIAAAEISFNFLEIHEK